MPSLPLLPPIVVPPPPPSPPPLQVDADVPLQPEPISIIKYTIIPLDTSNCAVSGEESQVRPHSKGVLEATAAVFTLIPLLCFAAGMM